MPCQHVMGRFGLARHLHADWRTNEARREEAPGSLSRPWEINDWLARNGNPFFLILDDDEFAWDGLQLSRWVPCDPLNGIMFEQWRQADEALKAEREARAADESR